MRLGESVSRRETFVLGCTRSCVRSVVWTTGHASSPSRMERWAGRLYQTRWLGPLWWAGSWSAMHSVLLVVLQCLGRHVVIVDDLVQSGGTLLECAKAVRFRGSMSTSCFVTHAVFPNDSWRKFTDPECEFKHFWITVSAYAAQFLRFGRKYVGVRRVHAPPFPTFPNGPNPSGCARTPSPDLRPRCRAWHRSRCSASPMCCCLPSIAEVMS